MARAADPKPPCSRRPALSVLMGVVGLHAALATGSSLDSRGAQFIGFSHFSGFEKSSGSRAGEIVLVSPVIRACILWDQLVSSWNVSGPGATYLKMEVRAIYPDHATKYYTMGLWSTDLAHLPCSSVSGQKDADGDVSTDTLILARPASAAQVRLTLGGEEMNKPRLKFVGLSLLDTSAAPPVLQPSEAAWGRMLPVPKRTQLIYPDGGVICSPTTVSMLLAYWSESLKRPELDLEVPVIAKAIYDRQWEGTGNWSFNTAFAGSFAAMRAYVTRLTDISELEDWIAAGIPVGLSVCYDRLRAVGPGPNGHLVVCRGFTSSGDPILNDPAERKNVATVFPRERLRYAWSYSRNTVYLIYPENAAVPGDRFGHWDSWTAHCRISLKPASRRQ